MIPDLRISNKYKLHKIAHTYKHHPKLYSLFNEDEIKNYVLYKFYRE